MKLTLKTQKFFFNIFMFINVLLLSSFFYPKDVQVKEVKIEQKKEDSFSCSIKDLQKSSVEDKATHNNECIEK